MQLHVLVYLSLHIPKANGGILCMSSFATAERKHVFAALSVTQCYLIHVLRIFSRGFVLFVWLCGDSSPY